MHVLLLIAVLFICFTCFFFLLLLSIWVYIRRNWKCTKWMSSCAPVPMEILLWKRKRHSFHMASKFEYNMKLISLLNDRIWIQNRLVLPNLIFTLEMALVSLLFVGTNLRSKSTISPTEQMYTIFVATIKKWKRVSINKRRENPNQQNKCPMTEK